MTILLAIMIFVCSIGAYDNNNNYFNDARRRYETAINRITGNDGAGSVGKDKVFFYGTGFGGTEAAARAAAERNLESTLSQLIDGKVTEWMLTVRLIEKDKIVNNNTLMEKASTLPKRKLPPFHIYEESKKNIKDETVRIILAAWCSKKDFEIYKFYILHDRLLGLWEKAITAHDTVALLKMANRIEVLLKTNSLFKKKPYRSVLKHFRRNLYARIKTKMTQLRRIEAGKPAILLMGPPSTIIGIENYLNNTLPESRMSVLFCNYIEKSQMLFTPSPRINSLAEEVNKSFNLKIPLVKAPEMHDYDLKIFAPATPTRNKNFFRAIFDGWGEKKIELQAREMNIRSTPNLSRNSLIGKYLSRGGESVELLIPEPEGDFVKVRLPDGFDCWIHKSNIASDIREKNNSSFFGRQLKKDEKSNSFSKPKLIQAPEAVVIARNTFINTLGNKRIRLTKGGRVKVLWYSQPRKSLVVFFKNKTGDIRPGAVEILTDAVPINKRNIRAPIGELTQSLNINGFRLKKGYKVYIINCHSNGRCRVLYPKFRRLIFTTSKVKML